MLVIERFIQELRKKGDYDSNSQIAPACILWPDHEKQWEATIPRLQVELPELLILCDYNPDKRSGPAIWLRGVIAKKIEDIALPDGTIPIIYLPGVSRQDLRAVESCPDQLKPLAELQYRGVVWSQDNAKDWTILAFLKTKQGGLGLDVAQDTDTKNAMQLAINSFLDEEIDLLIGKRLDKDYFNTLLTGGDPVRDLLQWLDQGDSFKSHCDRTVWKAFVEISKSQFAFNPESDGLLIGSAKFAAHEGPWHPVWDRYCEAPKRYPNIPVNLLKCKPPRDTLSWHTGGSVVEGWPQWNEEQENNLRKELQTLSSLPPHEARKKIIDFEKHHKARRSLIWADLGKSPLAQSLEHLSIIAKITSNALAAGTPTDLAVRYQNEGWLADDGVLKALGCIEKSEDFDAIAKVIRIIYCPWVEESAKYLQRVVNSSVYPGGDITMKKQDTFKDGECILFVDGLRFDIAKRLIDLLEQQKFTIQEKITWAALPTVTSTGKPAVSPVRNMIIGQEVNNDFEPSISETGQSLKGGSILKRLLAENGWQILERSSYGNGSGNAWCEFGNIDHEGHDRQWKLAKQIQNILQEIQDKIIHLFEAGWKSVHIVTDHGWLLLPKGLPKTELPKVLIDTKKWGRCAVIKQGAATKERLYPWYWNPNQHFALAEGISCYRKGLEYDHGGLSLQECLLLEIVVSVKENDSSSHNITITDIHWRKQLCTVTVEGNFSQLSLDIRIHPGDPASSKALKINPFNDDGIAHVHVEDPDLQGEGAEIVIIDKKGELVAHDSTTIGGGINE